MLVPLPAQMFHAEKKKKKAKLFSYVGVSVCVCVHVRRKHGLHGDHVASTIPLTPPTGPSHRAGVRSSLLLLLKVDRWIPEALRRGTNTQVFHTFHVNLKVFGGEEWQESPQPHRLSPFVLPFHFGDGNVFGGTCDSNQSRTCSAEETCRSLPRVCTFSEDGEPL